MEVCIQPYNPQEKIRPRLPGTITMACSDEQWALIESRLDFFKRMIGVPDIIRAGSWQDICNRTPEQRDRIFKSIEEQLT